MGEGMKKLDSDFFKGFFNILVLELVTLSLFIIIVTAIRFISPDFFEELKEIFEEYVLVNTDVSLVLGGEKG